jgi:hypothetical protein
VGHVKPRQIVGVEDVALHVALGVADADLMDEGDGQRGLMIPRVTAILPRDDDAP